MSEPVSARGGKPVRVQRKRTKGWRMPENTIYVGRPSRWGNPYGSASKDLGMYRAYALMCGLPLKDLRGKNLACWCALGRPCHADVLLEMANE